jgi:N-acetylglucosaminyldiphosphoundecaprenol N-acetyl-beta-D-mannosaminyltransferase
MATTLGLLDVRHDVGPVRFVSADLDAAADAVSDHAKRGTDGMHVHLLNAYSIALAERHPHYLASVSGDAVNLPDGKPIGWISLARRDTRPLQQIRGVQFFLRTFERGLEKGVRHFLLGSTPETLQLLESQLRFRYPHAEIVGSYSPPFRALNSDELLEQDRMIRKSGAEIVWVGLGTPKQDLEAARLARALPITAVAVGAAFDFVAGTVREAPAFVSRCGMEWAYRLLREPRRLWRRYLIGNVVFVRAVFSRARAR